MRWLIITLVLLGIASILPTVTFKTVTTCVSENDCVEEKSFELGPSLFSMARDYSEKSSQDQPSAAD